MVLSTNSVLTTQVLTRKFGALVAVDALSFSVQRNIIFGLLGPNGAGKSTLIKMLTTLLAPTSGDASIDNISITQEPKKVRELIGYVPQLISADGALTGYENLQLFAKLYHIPHDKQKIRINDALELMDLSSVAHNLVATYSGGMIRRLEIVQAMLHWPKVLFLDEPTTGLDIIARNNLWEYLQVAHKKYSITIFLTTHDMEEAEKLCDQIAIMDQGKIVIIGSPAELKLSLAQTSASLGEVFAHYTSNNLTKTDDFRATARQRKVNKILAR